MAPQSPPSAEPRPAALTERQRRVLAAAVEVFAERGYAGASTAEIAHRAGVAEGTIFKRFKTKKDLLLGAIGPYMIELGAPGVLTVIDDVLARPDAGVRDLVRGIARDRLRFVAAHPVLVRILCQEAPFHPELRDSLTEQIAGTLLPAMDRVIAALQARGRIDGALPPRSAARIVASQIIGYVLARTLLPRARWDDDREIDTLATVLERGLAPR
jgi:AcrR family transcriptional regulator